MAKEDIFMKLLGILFIIIGGIAILSAFPGSPTSVVSIGPIKITDVDQLDATRIAVGAVLSIIGTIIYKKK